MKMYMSDWLRDERGNITNNYKNVARAIQMLGCQAEDWNGPPTDDRWMLRLKGREESIPAVDAHHLTCVRWCKNTSASTLATSQC